MNKVKLTIHYKVNDSRIGMWVDHYAWDYFDNLQDAVNKYAEIHDISSWERPEGEARFISGHIEELKENAPTTEDN